MSLARDLTHYAIFTKVEREKRPRIVMQGNLTLAVDVSPSRGNPNPPKRGVVKGFSKASRKSMIRQCAKMGKAIPVFLTLTYGSRFPSDPKQWKRHLASFGKRLIRYNSELSAIWRLEPQKRGAPHYHLLIYQSNGKAPFVPKKWIAKAWSEVLGDYSDSKHLAAGTRIESLDSSRGAAFYVAKYVAKLSEDEDFLEEWSRAGRLWGSFNKSALPMAKQHEMLLHSEMEQSATLFAMRDCYTRAFLDKKVKSYKDSGVSPAHAYMLAKDDLKELIKDDEHFGNTVTYYGNAEDFIKELSFKILNLQGRFESERGFSAIQSLADRYAAAL